MAAQASYEALPRSSTSSDHNNTFPFLPPTTSPSKLKTLTLDVHSLFRLDAFICATISIGCLADSTQNSSPYHDMHYINSLIAVFVALSISLLSQLGALAASYMSRKLHVNVEWKGKNWKAPAERSVRFPPAARQRSALSFGMVWDVLLGILLLLGCLAYTIIAHLHYVKPTGVAGEVFCYLTGIIHLILAFLSAKQRNYRVILNVTTAPTGEISLEPKAPAVYQDVENFPALDV